MDSCERGDGSYLTIAERFGGGVVTLRRWVARYRDLGPVLPEKKRAGNLSDVSVKELEPILDKFGDANAGEITLRAR
jgi:transposase